MNWDKIKATLQSIPGWCARNHAFIAWAVTVTMTILATYFGVRVPKLPDVPPMPPIVETHALSGGQGWVNDPLAVQTAMAQIGTDQGMPPVFGLIARGPLDATDDNKAVFMWEAEQKVLGKTLSAWDQGSVGACVSFGWGRGVQDLILTQIVTAQAGAAEVWPGQQVATEPIYGGSRVEIGGNRIRGDGSVGAWAAQWVTKYGILFRQKYDGVDLSAYSQTLTRQWGSKGVPAALEVVAKEHPVKTVALVTTSAELWAAIGNGYPVPVCSNVGFEGKPPANGIMEPRGEWGHCMLFRGRFTDPVKGKCFVVQNSWGDYLHGRLTVTDKDRGKVELPEGCFAVRATVAEMMLAQKDSFAISGFKGFPKQNVIDWFAGNVRPAERKQNAFDRPLFALAP